jgi:MYXO-CTERM domain-containing protein
VYYPNGLTSYDDTNNVQQITIPSPQAGVYTVSVSGYEIPEGVPPGDDQPYAVVMSGGIQGLSAAVPSGIGVSPSSLSFTAPAGSSAPLTRQVSITNTGLQGSSLTWTVHVNNAPWLSVSPATGTAPSVMTVTADPENLIAGTYDGSIVVSADNSANSPVTVPVTFTLTSSQKSSSSNGCSCSTTGQGDPSDIVFTFLLVAAGFIVIRTKRMQ